MRAIGTRFLGVVLAAAMVMTVVPSVANASVVRYKTKIVFYGGEQVSGAGPIPLTAKAGNVARLLYYNPSMGKWIGLRHQTISVYSTASISARAKMIKTDARGNFRIPRTGDDPHFVTYNGSARWLPCDGLWQPPAEPTRANDLWKPPIGSVPATGTYVYLDSEPGDYIGAGQKHLYTAADAQIGVSTSGGRLNVSVDGDESWDGTFQAMNSISELKPGFYPGVTRYPFHDPAVGGLSWTGEGRGSNTLTGWFVVDSVKYENGALKAIDLRFELHNEGITPALHGSIRWVADSPVTPPGPVNPVPDTLWKPAASSVPATGTYVYLDSQPGDYIGAGKKYLYTPADAQIGVSVIGGRLKVDVDGDEWWNGDFQPMNTISELKPGYYPDLSRYPFHNPAKGGLSWSGEGRGSNTLAGWFVVDSVTYEGGVLKAIELRFEQHSEGGGPALHGSIRWVADSPVTPPGPVTPVPDTLWKPAASSVPATGTYVYLDSDPGDFIGAGQKHLYTPADAQIGVSTSGGRLNVSVDGDESWDGTFQTMNTISELKQGYYPGLSRFPFHNPAKGGLSWSGEGRGSNTLTGWFVVDSVTYEGGVLKAIELRFEQHSEGGTPALRGSIRWVADNPITPPGPVNPVPDTLWKPAASSVPATGTYVYLDSEPGDYIGAGRKHLYTPADAQIGVSTSGGRLNVSVDGDESWDGTFQTMNTISELQPGYYPGLSRFPFHNPAKGGLSWSGEGRGSNTLTGWFVVDSVTYEGGVLKTIELRFEQHSEGGGPALRGSIRWVADSPVTPPGPVNPIPDTLWKPAASSVPATGTYVYLDSQPGDYIGQGQKYLYTAPTTPITVTASGGFLRVSTAGWNGSFRTMNTINEFEPGYYPDLSRYPFHNPAKGGLSWSGQGRGSNTLTGWFVVDSVTYEGGVLKAIELRFEQHSEGGAPALHGSIRWSAGS